MKVASADTGDPWIANKPIPNNVLYGENDSTANLGQLSNSGSNVWVNCAKTTSCLACAVGCLSCTGTSTNCQSCDTVLNYALHSSKCIKCHSNCKLCTGTANHQCTKCASGYFLDGTTCGATCPVGKFKDSTDANNPKCSKCSNSCKSCGTNAADCTGCIDGKYLKTA